MERRKETEGANDGCNAQRTKRMSSVETSDVGVADAAICPTWHAHEQSSEVDGV